MEDKNHRSRITSLQLMVSHKQLSQTRYPYLEFSLICASISFVLSLHSLVWWIMDESQGQYCCRYKNLSQASCLASAPPYRIPFSFRLLQPKQGSAPSLLLAIKDTFPQLQHILQLASSYFGPTPILKFHGYLFFLLSTKSPSLQSQHKLYDIRLPVSKANTITPHHEPSPKDSTTPHTSFFQDLVREGFNNSSFQDVSAPFTRYLPMLLFECRAIQCQSYKNIIYYKFLGGVP